MSTARLCLTALAVASTIALSTGCVSSGTKMVADDVKQIKRGVPGF